MHSTGLLTLDIILYSRSSVLTHLVWLKRYAHWLGFPGGSDSKESSCNAAPGFDPWVRKIPWRRKWQPSPVLLPRESHGQGSLAVYSPCMTSQRVGHDWVMKTTNWLQWTSNNWLQWTSLSYIWVIQPQVCHTHLRPTIFISIFWLTTHQKTRKEAVMVQLKWQVPPCLWFSNWSLQMHQMLPCITPSTMVAQKQG